MSDTNPDLIARDKAMMLDPTRWPRHPLLPLVRRRGDFLAPGSAGLLFADHKPVVYVGLLFEPAAIAEAIEQETGQPATNRQVFDRMESIAYADIDALVAEWRVD